MTNPIDSKFSLTGNVPQEGALGGIFIDLEPKEVADAFLAGTGPSVPDSGGTPTTGTFEEGHIVVCNSNGNWELMTSGDITAAHVQLPFVVFSGNTNFSGRATGKLSAFHGQGRFDTTKYGAGTFTPGRPLVASAGLLIPKAAVGDSIQIVAFVGPDGLRSNGVLDVVMPAGVSGY